jgi:hypothetical protein
MVLFLGVDYSVLLQLPSLPDDDTPPESQLNSSHRVWANLLDTCKRHECPSFVLTTYQGWVFGSFSEDWTRVDISELKEFDATEPRVMQALVYWVACSMGLAGAERPVETVKREEADTERPAETVKREEADTERPAETVKREEADTERPAETVKREDADVERPVETVKREDADADER